MAYKIGYEITQQTFYLAIKLLPNPAIGRFSYHQTFAMSSQQRV